MEPFATLEGVAGVLPLENVDTDLIVRIERLTEGDQSKLDQYAFESIRYLADGSPDPAFPLNQPRWIGAPILLARRNFGCGSSREGAVTTLLAFGVRVVIAPSFGDIFYANCFQNGLLPIRLAEDRVSLLMELSDRDTAIVTVDLLAQEIRVSDDIRVPFDIDPMRREPLLTGLDDLGLTLRDEALITDWQARDRSERPWIWKPVEGVRA